MNKGIVYGVAAFLAWGFIPLYWRRITYVPAIEILCHRVVWSALFTLGLMLLQRRGGDVLCALRDRQLVRSMMVSAMLIAANWLIFIFAVNDGHVLQASLGYYINPLLSVAIGRLILKEELHRPQQVALAFAVAGVVTLAVFHGAVPWLALALAGTFAIYGFMRKRARADSLLGLCIEAMLLAPFAVAYLVWLAANGGGTFLHRDVATDLTLIGGGVITAMPLLWFAHAARRLDLSTVGILQYLAPSCQFILAVVVFHEPFAGSQLGAFALIWVALAVYTTDAVRRFRRAAPSV